MDQNSPQAPVNTGRGHFSTRRARDVVAVSAVFMFLATFAVIARFWARRIKRVKPATDDWLIIAGLIFYYFSAIINILQVSLGGLGRHIGGVTPDEIVITGKLGAFSQYAYALTMGFIRWSICSLLYRIFITKTFRRAILACNIVNVLWIVFSIFIVSLRCIPFSLNWNPNGASHCLAQVPIVAAIAAWGLAIELTIWTLPIPMSWNLQVPRSSKIALTLIFGLGIFDIGVGVGRLVTVLQVDEKDFTWTEVPAIEWLALEPSIAIIVACLCVCRPLLERVLPYRWRSNTASTNLRDEHIKLVHGVSSFVQTTSSVGAGNQGGSTTASQGEPDMIPANAVHVRKDILMRADDKV